MEKIYLILIILLTVFNLHADRVVVKVKTKFNDCQQIKDSGFSTGNGNYDIKFYGQLKTVYCDMDSSADLAYTEVPFEPSLLDYPDLDIYSPLVINSSINGGVYNSNTALSAEDRADYQFILDNGLTDWVRYTTEAYRNGNTSDVKNGDLILRLNGSYYTRDYREELPLEVQNINNDAPILVYASLASRSAGSDSDRSRMYFDQRDINNAFVSGTNIDTGEGNWSSTRNYVKYNSYLRDETTHIRFFGLCRRYTGTQCSADVLDFTFVLYPKLPKIGETVRIQYK